jgi:hypothetical protein
VPSTAEFAASIANKLALLPDADSADDLQTSLMAYPRPVAEAIASLVTSRNIRPVRNEVHFTGNQLIFALEQMIGRARSYDVSAVSILGDPSIGEQSQVVTGAARRSDLYQWLIARRVAESLIVAGQGVESVMQSLLALPGLELEVPKEKEARPRRPKALPDKPRRLWSPRPRGRPTHASESDAELLNFIREVYGDLIPDHRLNLYSYIRERNPELATAIANLKRRDVAMPDDIFIPNQAERQAILLSIGAGKAMHALKPVQRKSVRSIIDTLQSEPSRPQRSARSIHKRLDS